MGRLATVNEIIRDTAGEIGLPLEVEFPYDSQDPNFIQLRVLLNTACQELVEKAEWQVLKKTYKIVTQSTDTGVYDLPEDFSRMINQTGWEYTNRMEVGGPLTSQQWAYLRGRNLVSQTIYTTFRLSDNKLEVYPQPPPNGLDINFEYISRNFAVDNLEFENPKDRIEQGQQYILFEPVLVRTVLRFKFLSAKGFDASGVAMELRNLLDSRSGKDTGGQILSASNRLGRYPFLDIYRNTADTNYGL